jgi:hypothetical protein
LSLVTKYQCPLWVLLPRIEIVLTHDLYAKKSTLHNSKQMSG